MPLPKELTTVTPFLKYLAMGLFILMPFIGFFLGQQYQANKDYSQIPKQAINNPDYHKAKLTPSTSEGIANWKTYTDKDLHFSFKYPEDWNIDLDSHERINEEKNSILDRVCQDNCLFYLVIRSIDNRHALEFQIDKDIQATTSVSRSYSRDVIVAGIPAIESTATTPGNLFIVTTIKHQGLIYEFSSEKDLMNKSLEQENSMIYEKILSTFKIL